eukprot:m.219923 g.219923  ORF g.219923 m.219923 type:complete len:1694 (+) comp17238_c0_seq1:227-5308(+)
MGGKTSKLLTYEEALEILPEKDFQHLKDAFDQLSHGSGSLDRQTFFHYVLCGVPFALQDGFFVAFGGGHSGANATIGFKEFICGMSVYLHGDIAHRARLLFLVLDVRSQDALSLADFEAGLLPGEYQTPDAVVTWFRHNGARMEFEDFLPWVREHGECMQATAWVTLATPKTIMTSSVLSYYGTLEEHTGMVLEDIKSLERKYHQLRPLAQGSNYDRKAFIDQSCPPLSEALASRWFQLLDADHNGDLSFRELLEGVANTCFGDKTDRLKSLFTWFDVANTNVLTSPEVFGMLNALYDLKKALTSPRQPGPIAASRASSGLRSTTPSINVTLKEDAIEATTLFSSASTQPEVATVAAELLSSKFCSDVELGVHPSEFVDWAVATRHLDMLLDALDQYKHLVLCLRPATPEAEGDIIQAAMRRHRPMALELSDEKQRPRAFLVATSWWRRWMQHVGKEKKGRREPGASPSKNGGSSPRRLNRLRRGSTASANTQVSSRDRDSPSAVTPPPPINNEPLVLVARNKLTVSDWGAKLRPDVAKDRDFKLLSEEIWTALVTWYGGGPALPRPLFRSEDDGKVSVEIHPLTLRILHYTSKAKLFSGLSAKLGMESDKAPEDEKLHTSLWFYTDCSCNDTVGHVVKTVVKAQAKLADGRRDAGNVGARLWDYTNAKLPVLLSDERVKVAQAGIVDNHSLLLEIRNADLSWPSEMLAVARASALNDGVQDVTMDPAAVDKADGKARIKGLTGLSNLGNTCFMNSALQCLSHTSPLTEYCLTRRHFMELNVDNPLGYKGVVAKRYGDLVRQLYDGRRSVAPLKLRSAIQEVAPLFAGNQQHDAQELLAFVLDGLHEDLNRVTEKPYVERKDSDGRPDSIVAREHWQNHVARNRSIMVDLFHFQLRSQLKCMECGFTSVTFDPVSSLPLPLPSEGACTVELTLQRLDGKVPTKYALEVEPDCDYLTIKQSLAKVCNLGAEQMIVADVVRGVIMRVMMDREKFHGGGRVALRVFEVDLPCKLAGIAQVRAARRLESLQRASVTTAEKVPPMQGTAGTSENGGQEADTDVIGKRPHSSVEDHVQTDSGASPKGSNDASPRAKRVLSDSNPFKMKATTEGEDDIDQATDEGGADSVQNGHLNGNGSEALRNVVGRGSEPEGKELKPALNGGNATSTNGLSTRSKPRSASLTQADDADEVLTANPFKGLPVSAPATPMKKKEYPTMAGASGTADPKPTLSVLGRGRMDQYVIGHLMAIQRRWQALPTHLLCRPSRPVIMSSCVILPYRQNISTYNQLYRHAWRQVRRFVDQTLRDKVDETKSYPFKIALVLRADLHACARCPWYKYCTGCTLPPSDTAVDLTFSQIVSLDWDSKPFNLHYQLSEEYSARKDKTLRAVKARADAAVSIDDCIKSFIKEEKMEKEDLWYCGDCKKHQTAMKKLDIWTMPPFLIVHLKRFQMVNGGWRKSNKRVTMPLVDFNPLKFSPHVPALPKRTVKILGMDVSESNTDDVEPLAADDCQTNGVVNSEQAGDKPALADKADEVTNGHSEEADSSGSKGKSEGAGDEADDVADEEDDDDDEDEPLVIDPELPLYTALDPHKDVYLDPKQERLYDLYAITCHMGMLGGGHYVAYIKGSNNKWYLFNDSSCREVDDEEVVKESRHAYMLFYRAQGLDEAKFLPPLDPSKIEAAAEEAASDDKRRDQNCVVM